MLMVTESVPVQPLALVTVTIYLVVEVGEATGLAIFGLDNPVAGVHLYVAPWTAVVVNSTLACPPQMAVSLIVLMVSDSATFTVKVSFDIHSPLVAATI